MTRKDEDGSALGGTPELAERVHAGQTAPTFGESLLDVLQYRAAISGSPFAEHIRRLRKRLYEASDAGASEIEWSYDPQSFRCLMREDPGVFGQEYEDRSRECSEVIENGCALLADINEIRTEDKKNNSNRPPRTGPVWPVTVHGETGLAREILGRARAGANDGSSTKSTGLAGCAQPSWLQVTNEYGLCGTAAYPTFASGGWLGGLSTGEYGDWRQDYLACLTFDFYLEYNWDRVGSEHPNNILRDLVCMWDMPNLPADLKARRAHMMCDLAYFDEKRNSETTLRSVPTAGATAWVFEDRDRWRDFKACDSAIWGHYLSCVPGEIGRDDMMVSGLVNDWADLGPDLRFGECAQSVLTLTRGSLSTDALGACYERALWMLNAHLTPDAGIRDERFSMTAITLGVNVWNMCNHRHDVWRYYAIAADACAQLQELDPYRSCQLADCYTNDLRPTMPDTSTRISVPRRELSYDLTVRGRRHRGRVKIHSTIVDAVEAGVLPMKAVEWQFIIPRLLFHKAITPAEFLAHMDEDYCEHHAILVGAGHRTHFSREFVTAFSLLVMEQWWSGIIYAQGLGSLVEAQPGKIGNDRAHHSASAPADA
ncbi:hypothetical protein ACGFNU_37800 [Spirillospora sp. NPDC048911]|uniref:hypothetical protein n=1 Tax=Spirillospora sp. NPDC048911 TaxID=3364527 RepID=UPI00372041FA